MPNCSNKQSEALYGQLGRKSLSTSDPLKWADYSGTLKFYMMHLTAGLYKAFCAVFCETKIVIKIRVKYWYLALQKKTASGRNYNVKMSLLAI